MDPNSGKFYIFHSIHKMQKNILILLSSFSVAVPHYCVVKTYEAGRPVLTTVPSGWISGKYLHWPPKKVESLRRDVRSQPGATWSKMACKIKRRYIPTFNAAEQELAEMSGVTTDSDVGGPPAVKKMRKKASEYGTSSGMDFNSHFKSKGKLVLCFRC